MGGKPVLLAVCSEQCLGVSGLCQGLVLLKARGMILDYVSPGCHEPISAQISCL